MLPCKCDQLHDPQTVPTLRSPFVLFLLFFSCANLFSFLSIGYQTDADTAETYLELCDLFKQKAEGPCSDGPVEVNRTIQVSTTSKGTLTSGSEILTLKSGMKDAERSINYAKMLK